MTAEFCLACWNELNETNLSETDVTFSKYDDLCEGCAQYKKTIICLKKPLYCG